MSLAASQSRLCMITQRKSDLEFNMQMISQKRSQLALYASMPELQKDYIAEQLHAIDKKLENDMKQAETQYKIVSAEYDSVQKMVDDGAKKGFKYG